MTTLVPINDYVNTNTPIHIKSDLFEGQLVVQIKGFTDDQGNVRNSGYFERAEKKNITWSIQVQGLLTSRISR